MTCFFSSLSLSGWRINYGFWNIFIKRNGELVEEHANIFIPILVDATRRCGFWKECILFTRRNTVHSIRAVIKFYFRQLCVYAFHGSLWKYVGNSCNNTQTHANAPLYCPVLFPPPLSAVHRAHTHTERVTATFRTSRAIPVFRNRRKRKCTPSFDLRIYDRSNSIRFYPSLLLPWEIFVPMETVIYILHP